MSSVSTSFPRSNAAHQFGPSLHQLSLTSWLLWPLLTPFRVAPSGYPQVRTRCFPARPPHLPPRLNPRFYGVVPAHRIAVGLVMRFLFIGPPVSSSLPPPDWLPFRSWLRVVVVSRAVLLQGTFRRRRIRLWRSTPFTTRPCWAHTINCRILALTRQILICDVRQEKFRYERNNDISRTRHSYTQS